ncbi:hypothetical protein [Photobacterium malacitanum]|nr:hypothetical protein [Photobacterium malacitanum]
MVWHSLLAMMGELVLTAGNGKLVFTAAITGELTFTGGNDGGCLYE